MSERQRSLAPKRPAAAKAKLQRVSFMVTNTKLPTDLQVYPLLQSIKKTCWNLSREGDHRAVDELTAAQMWRTGFNSHRQPPWRHWVSLTSSQSRSRRFSSAMPSCVSPSRQEELLPVGSWTEAGRKSIYTRHAEAQAHPLPMVGLLRPSKGRLMFLPSHLFNVVNRSESLRN